MQVYVEAYNANGAPILGNLDGQRSWNGKNYKRTIWYRCLRNGRVAPGKYPHERVAFWRIVTGEKYISPQILETIPARPGSIPALSN